MTGGGVRLGWLSGKPRCIWPLPRFDPYRQSCSKEAILTTKAKNARNCKELHARMNRGLRRASLTEVQRKEYRRATKAVIARLSSAAVRRLHANTESFAYYPNPEMLTQAIKEKYPSVVNKLKATSLLKGMFDKDGTVHLDAGGLLRGRPATIVDFHAHELTHAIDGIDHELSDSSEWIEVWTDEMLGNDCFTKKAQDDHREAFSEIGSLLLGGTISVNELALLCPGVIHFWIDRHNLLAGVPQ